jgi:hypothetical protein
MPLARTFDLYELWCFFRLLRAGADEFGAAGSDLSSLFVQNPSGGLTIATESVSVTLGGGVVLCFQKRYREFWVESDRRGSFSRTMVPDIVLVPSAAQGTEADVIVLDAKYRIDQGLSEALNSIHTYRDALVQEHGNGQMAGIVKAAYLLAPALTEPEAEYEKTPIPGRLFHPIYRKQFRFGAATLKPGMALAEIRETLRAIIADSASS